MIGVVASEADRSAVFEFFELFKTPWEFHRPGVHYEVLLCSNGTVPENSARLLLLYSSLVFLRRSKFSRNPLLYERFELIL